MAHRRGTLSLQPTFTTTCAKATASDHRAVDRQASPLVVVPWSSPARQFEKRPDVYFAVGIVGRPGSNRIGGQAASRLAGDIVLAENSIGGRADLAGDFGEQHTQGQARSFMAAPTKIFSRSSIDRDAKHQSIMRSLDSEMAGGAGSELNQGVDPTKSE
jgi:hypothetical protein